MENDIVQGKRHYRTAPKGVKYLAALNIMYALLQMETRRRDQWFGAWTLVIIPLL
jgi:hypothetical protein